MGLSDLFHDVESEELKEYYLELDVEHFDVEGAPELVALRYWSVHAHR